MIYEGRQDGMNFAKEEIARSTNLSKRTGTIKDAMRGQTSSLESPLVM
jgi:hypothetical protein